MSLLRVESFAVSIDGYAAGPDQSLAHRLGVGGIELHEWVVATRTFCRMHGQDGGISCTDDAFTARGIDLPALGWRVAEHVAGEQATHVVLDRGAT